MGTLLELENHGVLGKGLFALSEHIVLSHGVEPVIFKELFDGFPGKLPPPEAILDEVLGRNGSRATGWLRGQGYRLGRKTVTRFLFWQGVTDQIWASEVNLPD
jgi:hypothetical protein